MRNITRHEGAGTGPADRDCVTDLEGNLAAQDVGDLVAVVMEMHRGHGADRRHLLEHHHALLGLVVPQLERGRATGGDLPCRPHPGHYDQAVRIHCCLRVSPGLTFGLQSPNGGTVLSGTRPWEVSPSAVDNEDARVGALVYFSHSAKKLCVQKRAIS